MKKNHSIFTVCIALQLHVCTNHQFHFRKTNQPLTKVSVFGNGGSIIAYSDIDGKIERKLINPSQEKFRLVYDNVLLRIFSYADLNKDVVELNDRVKISNWL